MKVCVECGAEDIPVIPPSDKCPHEYEIELEAADMLAKAAKEKAIPLAENGADDISPFAREKAQNDLEIFKAALAAYEKVRGMK